ncbi:MAG: histidinol dehydrogenase [Acidimicrobiales bacterium]
MLEVLDLRGAAGDLRDLLPRPDLAAGGPLGEVRAILSDVKARGDAAVRKYELAYDGVALEQLAVPLTETTAALDRIAPQLREALTVARDNIESFHGNRPRSQAPYERNGVRVETIEIPVERAGVYVPGGRAKYPSSVLMTAIPPKVAGVGAVALCVPPGPDGRIPDEVLAAAQLAGVDEIYRVGGAQAIAAMAYGTGSIEKVDVIVGAGSRWVSLAKQEVRGIVGVPAAFAGPSEVVVVADETVPAAFAAIDVLVQAEHGPDGLAWLVTWSKAALREINEAIAGQLAKAPRRKEIESTLATGGYAVLVDGPEQAIAVANEIAPEHLQLCCHEPERLVPLVRHAGAVFLGPYSPASLGDYLAGPSHVLPTFGSARFSSVLGVEDFLRRVHVITADRQGLAEAGRHVSAIARAEGLFAHASSVEMRLEVERSER